MRPEPAVTLAFAKLLVFLSADDHLRSFLKNFRQLEQTSLSICFWKSMRQKNGPKMIESKCIFGFKPKNLIL